MVKISDDIDVTPGVGKTVAADDVGGILHQRVKISQGADGSATDVSSAAPLQVTLANTAANTNKLLVTPDLPTGAATGAKQDTGNTSLSSIDGKITAVNTGAVTVASSALPSGAATSAKQPALGTAGTASSDVITVQGKTAMTPLLTDGSATTQPVSGTVTANAGSGTMAVSAATLPLPALAATSTKQSDGSQKTQIVDGSGNVISSTSNALNVNISSGASSGTEYTEDAASAANPVGTALNMVRDDARSGSITTTDGDNIAARGTNAGELYVKHVDTIPVTDNGGSLTVDGTVAATQSGTWNVTNVSGTVSLPTGAATAAKQPALGTAGTASADVITVQGKASMTPLLTDGSATTQPVSGTVSITSNSSVNVAQINGVTTTMGNGVSGTGVQRVTLASDSTGQVALAAGAATIGALTANQSVNNAQVSGTTVDTNSGNKSAGTQRFVLATDQPQLTNALKVDGSAVTQPISVASVPSHAVTNAGTFAVQDGADKAEDAAHTTADVGSFVLGVRNDALSSVTNTDGDYTQMTVDKAGRTITMPYAPVEARTSGTATATTTSTTSVVAASGSGSLRTYITDIQIANTGASTTLITIQDGSGGTALLYSIAPAGGGSNIHLHIPIRTTANTALYFAAGTASTTVYVSAQGYLAP